MADCYFHPCFRCIIDLQPANYNAVFIRIERQVFISHKQFLIRHIYEPCFYSDNYGTYNSADLMLAIHCVNFHTM